MTIFRNPQIIEDLKACCVDGSFIVEDGLEQEIQASHLTLLPALIDPHVHFRVPGQEYKEDWITASRAALKGGYTTVFDMPNNIPSCITKERLQEKKALIDSQLKAAGFPIHYELYLGADKNHLDHLAKVRQEVIGIKIFMGSSTGDLLMDDESSLHAVFSIASHLDLMVGIHAEDEAMIRERKKIFSNRTDYAVHSEIRSPEVAAKAIQTVIELVRLYGTRTYILHVSSELELNCIRAAKAEGLPVYAETSPHHLFLNTNCYEQLQGRAQMNPPLRDSEQSAALFAAIREGVIDTIGTDHAPHTLVEKGKPYGECPSGVPGIETNLPLLLHAVNQGKLSLADVVRLTHRRIKTIFRYSGYEDFVLVDLAKVKMIQSADLRTKCGWSPFEGMTLQGWPVYTILNRQIYEVDRL